MSAYQNAGFKGVIGISMWLSLDGKSIHTWGGKYLPATHEFAAELHEYESVAWAQIIKALFADTIDSITSAPPQPIEPPPSPTTATAIQLASRNTLGTIAGATWAPPPPPVVVVITRSSLAPFRSSARHKRRILVPSPHSAGDVARPARGHDRIHDAAHGAVERELHPGGLGLLHPGPAPTAPQRPRRERSSASGCALVQLRIPLVAHRFCSGPRRERAHVASGSVDWAVPEPRRIASGAGAYEN
ncbi:hypothetical protein MAPG_08731 [Magnaporthiopsis poae ATCC 64411]|uniref:Uncharacterized protein n=1 Tax=Magnaporthiopsis poae (strain ATCC 64411 / 73-15) TaxID=644358 RepID=A0A0C4E843_MAGP6|nr:hypothetical protein MAPG_08731 [Magnaporthiopsis poae ATCC 64411]